MVPLTPLVAAEKAMKMAGANSSSAFRNSTLVFIHFSSIDHSRSACSFLAVPKRSPWRKILAVLAFHSRLSHGITLTHRATQLIPSHRSVRCRHVLMTTISLESLEQQYVSKTTSAVAPMNPTPLVDAVRADCPCRTPWITCFFLRTIHSPRSVPLVLLR